MKKLILILLIILMLPMVVYAENCNKNDITVESIILSNKVGNAKEVNASSVDETELNLDVKLYDPNDSIEYKVIIKNSSFDTRKVTSLRECLMEQTT